MLKDGGAGTYSSKDLLAKIETLGADLGIDVGPDSTVLSLAVTKAHFDEAIDLLGDRRPRAALGRARVRQAEEARDPERVADKAKSSGTWAASMLLWRELYRAAHRRFTPTPRTTRCRASSPS